MWVVSDPTLFEKKSEAHSAKLLARAPALTFFGGLGRITPPLKLSAEISTPRAARSASRAARYTSQSCKIDVAGCKIDFVGCKIDVAGCKIDFAGCTIGIAGCKSTSRAANLDLATRDFDFKEWQE